MKAKKIKKPKHLARKLQNVTDPETLSQLTKQKTAMEEKKARRNEKFRGKVIELVGGKKYFNSEVFEELMTNGGGKLESIVEAVKIEKVNPKNIQRDNEEGRKSADSQEKNESPESIERHERPDDESPKISKETTNNTVENELTDQEDIPSSHESTYDDGKPLAKKIVIHDDKASPKEAIDDSKEESSDNDSSDSEDDDRESTTPSGRNRGRGRRGRQDADAKRDEQNEIQKETLKQKDEEEKAKEDAHNNRRCLGRKALTDFEVGKKYSGKIVYIKPKLGIFVDINCHTDAFCHISRCADDFIETITDDMFKIGDILEDQIRIVNIDRRRKKITASLQSDERIKDEESSNELWKRRQLERSAKKGKKRDYQQNSNETGYNKNYFDRNTDKKSDSNTDNNTTTSMHADTSEKAVEEEIIIDPENMTPSELKRARKLQRRAERRKQQELTGLSA